MEQLGFPPFSRMPTGFIIEEFGFALDVGDVGLGGKSRGATPPPSSKFSLRGRAASGDAQPPMTGPKSCC
jgi:hypothetical protein